MTLTVLVAILAAVLFGSATQLSKAALGSTSPFQLAGLLYLGAAAGVALPLAVRRSLRPPWRIDRKNRLCLLGSVVFGGVFGPLALLYGLRLAAASSVSLWLNLELVFTAVLGRFFFHDHLAKTGWIALCGIAAASVLLSWDGGTVAVTGGLLVAAASLCWGLDNNLTAIIDGLTPMEITFWKGLVAGLLSFSVGISLAPYTAGLRTTVGALLIGVFCYGASIVLYVTSAQRLGAARSQMFFASAPFFGMGLSSVLLGEPVTLMRAGSAALLAGSLVLLFVGSHTHLHHHVAMRHEHWHTHDDKHHEHAHADGSLPRAHSHAHEHAALDHSHPHVPDLHHRHEHGK